MARRTLIDFFADVAPLSGEFLVYDDGYRTWSYRYDEVGAAARAFADADPYAKAGLFESVEVQAYNWVFNKPEA